MQFPDNLPELIMNQREDDMLLDLRLIAQGEDGEEQQALQLKTGKSNLRAALRLYFNLSLTSQLKFPHRWKALINSLFK